MRKGARDHLWIVHSLTHSFIHSRPFIHRPLSGLCLALMPGSEDEQTTLPALREPTVKQTVSIGALWGPRRDPGLLEWRLLGEADAYAVLQGLTLSRPGVGPGQRLTDCTRRAPSWMFPGCGDRGT